MYNQRKAIIKHYMHRSNSVMFLRGHQVSSVSRSPLGFAASLCEELIDIRQVRVMSMIIFVMLCNLS